MTTISAIILTFNEALHIERAIATLKPIASQVFVIDSGSTDGTVEMARKLGAEVLQHPWVNYAQQFQWALANAPIKSEWVMRLDADELIEPDLIAEIQERLPSLPPNVTGVNLKRKHIFMGRWIRHGGRYPLVLLRIWRRGKARIEDRWMDEHMLLTEGDAVTFKGNLCDANLNDLDFFTNKHNKYATREAVDVICARRGIGLAPEPAAGRQGSMKVSFTRLMKSQIFNMLPFEVGSFGYFFLRYVFQLGFLDGREGAIYHFLQGYWYRFLVGAKIVEFERELGDLTGQAAAVKLSELTGLSITERNRQLLRAT